MEEKKINENIQNTEVNKIPSSKSTDYNNLISDHDKTYKSENQNYLKNIESDFNYKNNVKTMKKIDHSKIQEFLKFSAKLKTEKRHSWPEGLKGPKESVADHSYQLIVMVMIYHDKLDQKVDLLKSIYMAAIHDLPEAITGDIPLTDQTEKIKENKKIREMNAMEKICETLGDDLGISLFDLYREYEENLCYEAKFVRALDKIEAFQQHYYDPLETWISKEKEMLFQERYMIDFCKFDNCLLSLAEKVKEDCIRKLYEAGENVDEIKRRANNCK